MGPISGTVTSNWYGSPRRKGGTSSGGKGSERVKDWESARNYMERGRDPDDRPLANNTRLRRFDNCGPYEPCDVLREMGYDFDCFGVLLHSTYVVTYHFDGGFQLDTGGWNTVTTKDRISRFTPRWLDVGSKRRYIPMAERVADVKSLGPRAYVIERAMEEDSDLDYEEAVKVVARNRSQHESYWCVWIREGYIDWERRREDPDLPMWKYEEELVFEDDMVVYAPRHNSFTGGGLDPDRQVEHKLAGNIRQEMLA